MTTSLVHQLHFARGELLRAVDGLNEEDAARCLLPINSISWMVGHLANQEARYWVMSAQGDTRFSTLKFIGDFTAFEYRLEDAGG